MRSLSIAAVLFVACSGGTIHEPPPTVALPVPDGHVRLVVGGDSRDDSAHVLPWAFREAKARGASAFLFLGDMELTPSFDAHFRRELDGLGEVPFYPVLGNHEVKLIGFFNLGAQAAHKSFRAHFLENARAPVKSTFPAKIAYSVDLPGHVHF